MERRVSPDKRPSELQQRPGGCYKQDVFLYTLLSGVLRRQIWKVPSLCFCDKQRVAADCRSWPDLSHWSVTQWNATMLHPLCQSHNPGVGDPLSSILKEPAQEDRDRLSKFTCLGTKIERAWKSLTLSHLGTCLFMANIIYLQSLLPHHPLKPLFGSSSLQCAHLPCLWETSLTLVCVPN